MRLRRRGSRRLTLRRWGAFVGVLVCFTLLHYVNYLWLGFREIYLHLLAIPVLLVAYAFMLHRRHMLYREMKALFVLCAVCGFMSSLAGAFAAEDVLAFTHGRELRGEVLSRRSERVLVRGADDELRMANSVSLCVQYHDEQGQPQLLPDKRIILPHRFHAGDEIPLYALPVVIPEEEEGAYLTDGTVLMAGWGNMAYVLVWPVVIAAFAFFFMAFTPPHERRLRIEEAAMTRRRREGKESAKKRKAARRAREAAP